MRYYLAKGKLEMPERRGEREIGSKTEEAGSTASTAWRCEHELELAYIVSRIAKGSVVGGSKLN